MCHPAAEIIGPTTRLKELDTEFQSLEPAQESGGGNDHSRGGRSVPPAACGSILYRRQRPPRLPWHKGECLHISFVSAHSVWARLQPLHQHQPRRRPFTVQCLERRSLDVRNLMDADEPAEWHLKHSGEGRASSTARSGLPKVDSVRRVGLRAEPGMGPAPDMDSRWGRSLVVRDGVLRSDTATIRNPQQATRQVAERL